ncbi:MAG: cysteine desulfurase family protein [Eubacteriales bacterium]|nr:cysteine desulfurase family protein [Eubacteriales bacterium]
MRDVYFDNAATTRVRDEVAALCMKVMTEEYGNPSSKHLRGMEAEKLIKEASEKIARTMKVKPSEIVFTSGGTESNNLALIGTALSRKRRGKHIISCQIEHAAIYKPMEFLEENGYEIEFIPVDEKGHVDLKVLESKVREDTILVSVMAVNNEIGSIEPIKEIAEIVKRKNPACYVHTDAINAYGKIMIRPKQWKVDMVSMSSHKIHGPKGCGFLYIDEKCRITPLILGGGQQKDMRSGTENVPGIASMGLACELYYKEFEKIHEGMLKVRERLTERLSALEGVTINSGNAEGENADFSAHVLSVSFEGIRAEVLLHALEEKGISVSSGSACSSNHPGISGTLKAIGVRKELLDSTIRFSFGIYNTEEEADYCADCIEELLPVLRRFTRY